MRPRLQELIGRPVSRETSAKLARFEELLREEAQRQNLIAESTLENLWERHIVDSAQLLRLAPSTAGPWVDVGSGAGLPGLIVAILSLEPVTLVEPRRLRADFLDRAASELALENVTVVASKIESARGRFRVITARAVAPLAKLLGITVHLASQETLWVLPKGRNAKSELADAQRSWHYDVRVEPSCTDPEASILLLSNVRAKRKP